jgi:acetolactate synthase I/II/III large subunit
MKESSNKTQQIGAELVVRTLEMHGVTHIFGVPGAKIRRAYRPLLGGS